MMPNYKSLAQRGIIVHPNLELQVSYANLKHFLAQITNLKLLSFQTSVSALCDYWLHAENSTHNVVFVIHQ